MCFDYESVLLIYVKTKFLCKFPNQSIHIISLDNKLSQYLGYVFDNLNTLPSKAFYGT